MLSHGRACRSEATFGQLLAESDLWCLCGLITEGGLALERVRTVADRLSERDGKVWRMQAWSHISGIRRLVAIRPSMNEGPLTAPTRHKAARPFSTTNADGLLSPAMLQPRAVLTGATKGIVVLLGHE